MLSVNPITLLIERLTSVTGLVSRAALRAAAVAGAAALAVTTLVGAGPPTGFGVGVAATLFIGFLCLLPAGVLLAFSLSTAHLGRMVADLPAVVRDVAEDALDQTVGLAGTVQAAVAERRGIPRLLRGIWGLRGLAGRFRDMAGQTAPAVLAVNPFFLAVTAIAVFGGVGVLLLALLLALVRFAI